MDIDVFKFQIEAIYLVTLLGGYNQSQLAYPCRGRSGAPGPGDRLGDEAGGDLPGLGNGFDQPGAVRENSEGVAQGESGQDREYAGLRRNAGTAHPGQSPIPEREVTRMGLRSGATDPTAQRNSPGADANPHCIEGGAGDRATGQAGKEETEGVKCNELYLILRFGHIRIILI